MTETHATTPATSPATGLDAYTEALEQGGAPILGHLVLYSVYDGRVTPDQLALWVQQLGLDAAMLPGPIRAMDVFERVTGPKGVRASYPLADPASTAPGGRRRRRPTDGTAVEALLMVRHVRRDTDRIVRHLVREVRDETQTRLSYDARLAEIVFEYDRAPTAAIGDGSLAVKPNRAAIAGLPEAEQTRVQDLLADLEDTYRQGCHFLTGDRLRGMIRAYVEGLDAIRIRPTGGVYFVTREHSDTLSRLRELVARMGEGSHLSRIPLPDQGEMREMITNAYATRATSELQALALDIAAARRDGLTGAAVQTLHKKFQTLQASAAAHSELLSSSLEDTTQAMQTVQLQLISLLQSATDEDDEPEAD
ncbi:DUF6744 family protein [Streptosporangium saharense]|uniref:DUF6744 family protein n=1 Tax=Streptosporangium saharense TaxID=1706840 RepID=UPI003321CA08